MLAVLGLAGGVPTPASSYEVGSASTYASPAYANFRESFERFRAIARAKSAAEVKELSAANLTISGNSSKALADKVVLDAPSATQAAVATEAMDPDKEPESAVKPVHPDGESESAAKAIPIVDVQEQVDEPAAEVVSSESNEATTEAEPSESEKDLPEMELSTEKKKLKKPEGAITVVILSDRVLPLQASLGSIVMTTDAALDIWVLGDRVSSLEKTLTKVIPFKENQKLNVLSMDDAEKEIKGMGPSWMRPHAGKSINNPSWRTNLTILQEEWDHDSMHYTRFNLMRFYLAHLSMFSEVESILFVDDDVILQKDIATLAKAKIPEDIVIVGQCDGFSWQDDCHKYESFTRGSNWKENSAALYLSEKDSDDQPVCEYAEGKCGPPLAVYTKTIEDLSADQRGTKIDFVKQPVWNFGLVYMNLKAWRDQDVTTAYQWWLDKNEELHIYPEDSLAFGLGIPYLALADKVACWNDFLSDPTRDGLGYITMADFMVQGVDDIEKYLADAVFLHYSGRRKPWSVSASKDPLLEPELAKPFYDVTDKLGLPPAPSPPALLPRVKALFVTEPRSGSEWFMDTIDAHPQVCATGEREFPTNGFAREALIPGHYAGVQFADCAVKKGCQWGFIAQYVPTYIKNYNQLCPTGTMKGLSSELIDTHGKRLCKWADAWKAKYGDLDPVMGKDATDKLWKMYDSETFDDDSDLSPCSCRGKQVQMLKFMRGWAGDDEAARASYPAVDYYNGHFNSFISIEGTKVPGPELELKDYKIVEFVRNNTFDQCLSLAFASATSIWHENDLGSDASKISQIAVNETWMAGCINHVEKTRTNGTLTKMLAPLKEQGKVLTLYYEQCDDDPSQCLDLATTFLTNPSVKATDLPPVAEYSSEACADDWSFTDKSGNGCFVWDEFDCSEEVGSRCGYSSKEMDEIRSACPVACGTCPDTSPAIHGDPIFKYGEKAVKFTLDKNELTSLMTWTSAKGDKLELFGQTFGKGETQWFKRFAINSNGKEVLNVNVVRQKGMSMMRTRLDDEIVTTPNYDPRNPASPNHHESKDKAVKLSSGGFWDSPKSRSGKEINIVAGDVSIRIRSSMAKKSAVHKIGNNDMHLNVKVTSKLPSTSRGFFAELAGVQPLSSASKMRMSYSYKKTAAQKKAATSLRSTSDVGPEKKDMSCPARYNEPTASTLPPLPKPDEGNDEDEDEGDEIDNGPSPPFSGSGGANAAKSTKESTLIDFDDHHSAEVTKASGNGDGSTIKKSGIDAEGEGVFERIANEKEFTHNLFRDGHLWRVKHTLYYFTWADSASGGEEVASYLARLPLQYVVPGSNTTGPFDYEAFQRSHKQLAARDHPVIAFGQGSAAEFFEMVKQSHGVSRRAFLPITIVRDTLSHRLVLQEMANADAAKSTDAASFLELQPESSQDWQMRFLVDTAYDKCVDNCTIKRLNVDGPWFAPGGRDHSLQVVMQSFGLIANPQNPVASMCLMARLSGLPIPYDEYGKHGTSDAARSVLSEKSLLDKSDDAIAKIMRENSREALMVAKLHDHFEALAEKHGCLSTGLGSSSSDSKAVALDAAEEASSQELKPLYYFMSTPKTGGNALGSMLASLPSEYVLPGSQLSAPFDFAALQTEAKGIDHRPHPIVAFGHSGRSFLQQLAALRVTKRPVVLLGVVRDTMLHRVSYFQQYIRSGSNYTEDFGGDKHAEKEMTSWVRSFRYPANAQMQPFLSLESTWKTKTVGQMWTELMDSNFEQFRNDSFMDLRMGLLGMQSNLRATACTFAKMTKLPIKWSSYGYEGKEFWELSSRSQKQRASLTVKSFNATTALTMLSRDAREVAFVALAQARFESLAAEHGCMPTSAPKVRSSSNVKPALPPAPPATESVQKYSDKCRKLPEGKKLAVAAVWVDVSKDNTTSRMTHDNCKTMLALLQARAALTQDQMCYKKEDVKMVLLTDFSRMPEEEREMYKQHGVSLRNAAADTSAMRDFAKKMDLTNNTLNIVHMLKLAAFWETSYSAIVLIDTDLVLDKKQPIDMFSVLMAPNAPQMIYRAGTNSPINAGLIGLRPRYDHYKSFLTAVSNGFDPQNGWGGKYSTAGLRSLQLYSARLQESADAKQRLQTECGNGPWCFIGRDQDQGMLAHLMLNEEHPIKSMPLDASINYGKHYAFKPKPWFVSQYEQLLAGKKNTQSTWDLKVQLGQYWDDYRGKYEQAWDDMNMDASATCRAMFACGYSKAAKLLPELGDVADKEQEAHDSLMSAASDCKDGEEEEEAHLAAYKVDVEPKAEHEPEGALQPKGLSLKTDAAKEKAEAAAERKAAADKRREEVAARKAEAEKRREEAAKRREEAVAKREAAKKAKETKKVAPAAPKETKTMGTFSLEARK